MTVPKFLSRELELKKSGWVSSFDDLLTFVCYSISNHQKL